MPAHPSYAELMNRTAANLSSLLVSLNEYPYFRFDVDQPITGQIAAKTYMYLENHIRNDADYWYRGLLDIRNRSTVLIVSRLSDVISPLLHSIAYEAMFQDYLHVSHDGKVSVNPHNLLTFLAGGLPASVCVDESSELWRAIRDQRLERCSLLSSSGVDAKTTLLSFLNRYEKSLDISNRRESPIRSINVVVGAGVACERRARTSRTRSPSASRATTTSA